MTQKFSGHSLALFAVSNVSSTVVFDIFLSFNLSLFNSLLVLRDLLQWIEKKKRELAGADLHRFPLFYENRLNFS